MIIFHPVYRWEALGQKIRDQHHQAQAIVFLKALSCCPCSSQETSWPEQVFISLETNTQKLPIDCFISFKQLRIGAHSHSNY